MVICILMSLSQIRRPHMLFSSAHTYGNARISRRVGLPMRGIAHGDRGRVVNGLGGLGPRRVDRAAVVREQYEHEAHEPRDVPIAA